MDDCATDGRVPHALELITDPDDPDYPGYYQCAYCLYTADTDD